MYSFFPAFSTYALALALTFAIHMIDALESKQIVQVDKGWFEKHVLKDYYPYNIFDEFGHTHEGLSYHLMLYWEH
ncbi:hypothetical protein M501DRAFT_1004616 [Patellaria atrata CBS 101060]|uniref:Uncharacterized protein n=1 Tax=Patellaria atrata CBS 101060 TaxID=1346257 RepID=A0A9P4SA28_9PEZI|nr:hypothetical protein M501DRAFT_1004616 [Patellaria atrata CBS 101060]